MDFCLKQTSWWWWCIRKTGA